VNAKIILSRNTIWCVLCWRGLPCFLFPW